jgi:CheY-like chemotaxis protein
MAGHPLILIVDDHADARDMYGMYLAQEGFRWIDAVNGQDAITQAHVERPSLILMDLTMPRLDGWEAIRLLKIDAVTAAIPLIVLTGNDSPDARRRAEAAGVAGFLVKPVPPDDLAREIRRALKLG